MYFTTPNMYFPVESHTRQLFRHWSRPRFEQWLAEHAPYVAQVDRLRLLGFGDLVRLMRCSTAKRFQIVKNRFVGWPMTFSVIAGRE